MHVCTTLRSMYFNVFRYPLNWPASLITSGGTPDLKTGDTVFKQFFMDYVKKIGFYNGS